MSYPRSDSTQGRAGVLPTCPSSKPVFIFLHSGQILKHIKISGRAFPLIVVKNKKKDMLSHKFHAKVYHFC